MAKSLKEIIRHPFHLFMALGHRELLNWIDDETYLKIAYRICMGKRLNLDCPVTFNEKLQWLKLHDRKPEYTTMVDKYEAKKWVADRIGGGGTSYRPSAYGSTLMKSILTNCQTSSS